MKKLFLTHLFALVAVFAMAVPVQRGQWKTITLADGSKVRVEAVGDELCHYWRSEAGNAFVERNNIFVKIDAHEFQEAAHDKRQELASRRMARFEKNFGNSFGEVNTGKMRLPGFKKLSGVKKGLVMLIQFADIHFTKEHTPEFYKKVLNEGGEGNPELRAKGYDKSVKQYFFDQSNDKFSVDFDVTPIITMPNPHGSYTNGVPTMIRTAISELKYDESIDWTQYDWDDDGEIDMVFVLYAGYGQATKTDDTSLIWPHESSMYYNKPYVGGKLVNTYACTNEINWNFGEGDMDSGIGTFCHEFAHCLGYPDLYDPDYACAEKGLTAMDYWDLLDSGSYNKTGFCPAPFSIYEKMTAGWITPQELEMDKEYSHLRPITDKDGGDVYIMTNPNNKNEFYAFEPIQNVSWAEGFFGAKGLRVLHIDYKAEAWSSNVVNCASIPSINKYSRYTYIPADGSYATDKTSQVKGDLYPYQGRDYVELKWYTGDSKGNKDCPMMIYDIVLNADKTISFKTKDPKAGSDIPESWLYYESFNKCSGTGGCDNVWTNVTTSDFVTDNEWTTTNGKGAYKCVILGSSTAAGVATTDDIKLEPGDYKLTFKAARYGNESPKISISDPNNTTTVFSQTTFELVAGQWNDCEATMTVGNVTNIRFRNPSRGRFFLDEIIIEKAEANAIMPIVNTEQRMQNRYNLSGQKVGTGYHGIVIKNGKKYIAK